MKIAYQTLACPGWSWDKVVAEAKRLGYDGIEIRGIEGEMYLPKARPFLPEQIEQTKAQLKENGLEICCLDTSCSFHAPEKFEAAIQEGKDTIELAGKLGVRYIRVFGDKIPDPEKKEEVVAAVARGLQMLGGYAEQHGAEVLLETHGDFNRYDVLLDVFEKVSSPAVGMLWDFEHPYMHGEEPQTTFNQLAPYIRHTHVKDARNENGEKVLCMIGEGEVPVPEIVHILQHGGYDGWLSLEFEKQWKPYLEEPEVSLPAFITYMRNVLKNT
jgi:sugar phosphate isomerase/epimerase